MTSELDRGAATITERPPSHGVQLFQQVGDDQLPMDAVGRPLPHLSARQHATGEAIYVDDMPTYRGNIQCRATKCPARPGVLSVSQPRPSVWISLADYLRGRDLALFAHCDSLSLSLLSNSDFKTHLLLQLFYNCST